MVWARLPNLLLEFLNEDLLIRAGNGLGKDVRLMIQ